MSRFELAHLEKPLGGRYKILTPLGEGGFGQTFLAEDLHLPDHPRCVVKQLKPQASDAESWQTARRLFDMEAQALYKLGNHEQIPRLLAHFEEGQEFYLAQELIEGETLTQFLAEGQPWSEANVVALLQDILQVLAFVHQHHVIHRDIKPANLIRRQQDGKFVLIDFGAVKQVSTQLVNTKTGKTQTIAIGTQGYMPSEQLAGNPRFSSDVYAVGMLGIQLLTGIHPHHLGIDPQTSEINWHDNATHVSSELIAIFDRMVRYDFRSRYPTALEALEAVQSLSAFPSAHSPLPQSAFASNPPDGVTVTLPHRANQLSSSVAVANAPDNITVTLAHRASPSLSPVIPATISITQEIAKTAAVTPTLRERRSSRLWLPVLGGALSTIAAVSLGTALLKAQQALPLFNEAPNSTASSAQTSSPKGTYSPLKSPTPIQAPVSQPSTSSAPSHKRTIIPTSKVNPSVRVISQPQSTSTPVAAPASNAAPPVRAISQRQPNPPQTGNQPTLTRKAAREKEPPTRDVKHPAKAAAKKQEREVKEATKKQEQGPKKATDKPEKGKH